MYTMTQRNIPEITSLSKDQYNSLKASGLFWEIYPDASGSFEKDVIKQADENIILCMEQVNMAASFLAKHNSYFRDQFQYLKDRILECIESAVEEELTFISSAGFTISLSHEDDGNIYVEVSVDPSVSVDANYDVYSLGDINRMIVSK